MGAISLESDVRGVKFRAPARHPTCQILLVCHRPQMSGLDRGADARAGLIS